MQSVIKPQKKAPWFDVKKTEVELVLRFGGAWICRTLSTQEAKLRSSLELDFPKALPTEVFIEGDCIMDMAGACLIARIVKILKSQGCTVKVIAAISTSLLDKFLTSTRVVESPSSSLNWKTQWLDYIGYHTLALGKTGLGLVQFFGEVLVTWASTLKTTPPIRWVSFCHHVVQAGVKAVPIVGLMSFLIGMVLGYQSINQLSRFGAEIYTVDFLGVSILREIAVLLTAIMVAGRSGSAFAAQIGTMSLNQEIDAIRVFSLNPILILVIPRILALLVCVPLLVFFSMVMGLLGGLVITNLIIDLPPTQFVHQLHQAISIKTFWVGMSKAPLFAVLIGLVGNYRGFQVKKNAESVGRMTTQSVVESIFLVIICDAFMSILFSYLKV